MNVVIRGIQAAGMAVYAAMHVLQAADAPQGSPTWLVVAFALSALAAVVIAVGLILTATEDETRWEALAAALAAISALALLAAYTVGLFGVVESDLRAETAIVLVAELMTLGAFALGVTVHARTDAPVDEPPSSAR